MGRILILSLVLVLAGCASSGDDGAPTTTTVSAAVTTVAPGPQATTTTVHDVTTTTAPPASTTTLPGVVVLEVAVADGEVAEIEATLDDEVRLVISAEVSDEVHLHTYDIHADVSPGQPAVIEFDASIPGVFEIEFEQAGTLIAELTVAP